MLHHYGTALHKHTTLPCSYQMRKNEHIASSVEGRMQLHTTHSAGGGRHKSNIMLKNLGRHAWSGRPRSHPVGAQALLPCTMAAWHLPGPLTTPDTAEQTPYHCISSTTSIVCSPYNKTPAPQQGTMPGESLRRWQPA